MGLVTRTLSKFITWSNPLGRGKLPYFFFFLTPPANSFSYSLHDSCYLFYCIIFNVSTWQRWVTASVTTWDLNLHPLTFQTFPLPLSYSAWTEPSALGSYEVKMFHTMEKFFSLFTKIKGGIWTIKGRHVSTEPLSSNSTSCRWSEEDSWLNSNQFKPRIEPATTGFGSSPPAGGAIPLHQSLSCFIPIRKAVDSEQHMGLKPWMVELQHHTNPLHPPGRSSQTRFHLPLGPGRGNWTQT